MTMPFTRRRALLTLIATIVLGGALHSQGTASFDQLMQAARYTDAERVARERLGALESASPVDSELLAAALSNLASALLSQDRAADARPFLARATAVYESTGATDTPAFLRILLLWADHDEEAQDFEALITVGNRAADLAARLLPPADRLHLMARKWRAAGWYRQGRYQEAEAELRQVLEGLPRVVPPDSLELSDAWHSLALDLATLQRLHEALDAAQRGLEIRERRGDVYRAAHSANIVGTILAETGDYSRARTMLDRAIRYREQTATASGPAMARTLRAYAELLALVGDVEAAGPAYQRAMAFSAGLPLWMPTAVAYAEFLMALGEIDKARTLLTPIAQMAEQPGSAKSPSAYAFLAYAAALRASGDVASAAKYADRAVMNFEELGLPLGLAASLALKGLLVAATDGDRAGALLLQRSVSLLEGSAYASSHRIRLSLAEMLAKLGDNDPAQRLALASADGNRTLVRLALRSLSERQALVYAGASRQALDLAVAALQHDATLRTVIPVFDRVVRARAIVLDEVSRRQQSFDAPETREEHQRWIAARERLARIVVRGAGDADAKAYAAIRARAQADADRAEEELAAVSARTRDARRDERVGSTEVLAALGSGDALIAYVRYRDAASPATNDDRYGAFVTAGGGSEPRFVPLGSARPIEDAVSQVRAELLREARSGGRSSRILLNAYRRAATTLRRLVWDPVSGAIGQSTRAFIVPDGALHLVSFAALPVGTDRFLIDRGPTIHHLAAERDLVRAGDGARADRLLAIGDARFDSAPTVATSNGGRRSAESAVPCADFSAARFAPLPDSLNEARTISGLWRQSNGVTLLHGEAASETAIKQHAGGHRIVHLATHGFFLDNGDCPSSQNSALLRSGLALAGANQRDRAGDLSDDGILTASEVASLDLSGTEWAVLSACDTGLGSITAGEGVLGLQRAFRMAGAATVIMSLWPVDDRATRDWMMGLYQARLRDGKSTDDAVRTATERALNERRRNQQSVHPFYWAGFIASGDWR